LGVVVGQGFLQAAEVRKGGGRTDREKKRETDRQTECM